MKKLLCLMVFALILATACKSNRSDYAYTTPPQPQSQTIKKYERGDVVFIKPDSLQVVIYSSYNSNYDNYLYVYWHNELRQREEGKVYPEFIY